MYDLRAIRENPAWFDAALKRRGLESLSSQVLEMDESRRSSQTQLGELQARRNAASKEIGAAMKDKDTARADALKAEVAEIKDKMTALEEAEAIAEGKLHQLLAGLPNRPDDSVPDGADEDDNEEVKRWGTPVELGFEAKQHFELGEDLCVFKRYDMSSKAPSGGINEMVLSLSNRARRTHWWNLTSSSSTDFLPPERFVDSNMILSFSPSRSSGIPERNTRIFTCPTISE